jgi:L-ascorbate metabolism protein UlaG (beta-lactamase superfamily)
VCVLCALGAAAPARGPAPRGPFPGEEGPLPWPDGRLAGGRLTWTGVAGLRLDLDGHAIAFDPFASRPGIGALLFRAPRPDQAAVAERFSGLDAVFVGHTHYDHAMDLAAVACASPRARIHGGSVTRELCRRLGLPERRLVPVQDATRATVGPFTVEAIESRHGVVPLVRFFDRLDLPRHGLPRTPFRYPRGEVFAWRVTAGRRTFHVQGSAGIAEGPLERQGPADALVACLAARKGTPGYLARLGERLRPGVLVPCHHDDFFRPLSEAPRPVRTLDWPALLADAARLRERHGTRLWRPPRDRPVDW